MPDPRRAARRWNRAAVALGVAGSVVHIVLIEVWGLNIAVVFVAATFTAVGRGWYWTGRAEGIEQAGEVPDHG